MSAFKEVYFRPDYPQQQVAANVVVMQFGSDEAAIAFRDFWNVLGAEEFSRWLEANERQRKREATLKGE